MVSSWHVLAVVVVVVLSVGVASDTDGDDIPLGVKAYRQAKARECDIARDNIINQVVDEMWNRSKIGETVMPEAWLSVELLSCGETKRNLITEIAGTLCAPDRHYHVVCDTSIVKKRDMVLSNMTTVPADMFPIYVRTRPRSDHEKCDCPRVAK